MSELNISQFCNDYMEKIMKFHFFQILIEDRTKKDWDVFKKQKVSYLENLRKIKMNNEKNTGIDFLINKVESQPESKELFIDLQRQSFLLFKYGQLENYFFKCFKHILKKHTKEFIGKQQVTIEKLLEYQNNLDMLIYDRIEKKILDVFIGDINKIFHFAKKPLGIMHQITKEEISTLNKFKQVRNLYAHGDGKVTQNFLNKVRDTELTVGDKFVIDENYLIEINKIEPILFRFDKALLQNSPELKMWEKQK